MFVLKKNERIDWFRVIVDIERSGWSLRKLGAEVGVPHSTLQGWKLEHGRPKFEESVRVIVVWGERTKLPVEQVPRKNMYAW